MNYKAIIVGAVSGFTSAVIVDLNNWRMAPDGQAFNWQKAIVHWGTGAVSGVLAALGLGTVAA